MTTTVKMTPQKVSAAWKAHLRDRRTALLVLATTASSILSSLSYKHGVENGVYVDKLMMGETVIFEASGYDFVIEVSPRAIIEPLLSSLMRMAQHSIDATDDDVSAAETPRIGSTSTAKQARAFHLEAEMLKLLETAMQMTIDLNEHSSIKDGEYIYAVKLGDRHLFHASGKDYEVQQNFGKLFTDLKAPLMKLFAILSKGKDISMFDTRDEKNDKSINAAA